MKKNKAKWMTCRWSKNSEKVFSHINRWKSVRNDFTLINTLSLSSLISALTSLPWVESGKYSVANWPSSTFPYPSSHSQPPHAHTSFPSTTNPSSFGQTYYPPTPPKDLPHDTLLDSSNKQQGQQQAHHNISPTANYQSHPHWGHVLKDSSLFWSTMKPSPDSPTKNFNSKKKPSQGERFSSSNP